MAREDPSTCNTCGAPTVKRINRRSGREFWGCSRWNKEGTGCKGYGGKRAPRGKPWPPATTPAETSPKGEPMMGNQTELVPPATAPSGDAGTALWALIRDSAVRDFEARVTHAVSAALAAMPEKVSRIEFVREGVKLGETSGHVHEAFGEVARLAAAGQRNFYLVGPAGTGKSTIAKHFAAAISLTYAGMDCTEGTTEPMILGRSVPNISTGDSVYQSTPIVDAIQNGGVACLDEADWPAASVMGCLHECLSNGHLFIPAISKSVPRHPDSYIFWTANTFGKGATRQYLRNQLDAATLDRFKGGFVNVEFDSAMAKSLVGPEVFGPCEAIRTKLTAVASREVWGMRAFVTVARLHANGFTIREAIERCLRSFGDADRNAALGAL